MVLDSGKLVSLGCFFNSTSVERVPKVEFDRPSTLLKDERSAFRRLVDQDPDSVELHKIAQIKGH